MYSFLRIWINTLITSFNTGLNPALFEVDNTIDTDKAGAHLRNYTYAIRVNEINDEESENEKFEIIGISIELSFNLVAKDINKYQTVIDTYSYPLKRMFQNNKTIALSQRTNGTYTVMNIDKVKLSDLNKFDGSYLKPIISFEVKVGQN